jgi:hypothetical protein
MKENWFAILMFSIIFGILGYLLGICGCCTSQNSCAPSSCCSSHKACCSSGDAASCADVNVWVDEEDGVHVHMDDRHEQVELIVESLSEDFVGDTTIAIEGGEIRISKSEDGELRVEVQVEEEHGEGGSKQVRKEVRVEVEEE